MQVKLNPDCYGKSRIPQEDSFISKFDLNLSKKLVKCYIWSTALYGAKTWTLWKVDQKYLESFEVWYWIKRWRRSVGPMARDKKKYCTESRRK